MSCWCIVAVDPDESSRTGEGGTQVHRHFEQVRSRTLPDAWGKTPVHGTFTPLALCTVIHGMFRLLGLVACHSGSAFYPINEVTLRRAGLVLWWVTACRQVNHPGMQSGTWVNSAFHPSGVGESSTGLFGWG